MKRPNEQNKIAVVTSKYFPENVQTPPATDLLFGNKFPIFYFEETSPEDLGDYDLIIFSGFDEEYIRFAWFLNAVNQKIAVFWHHSIDDLFSYDRLNNFSTIRYAKALITAIKSGLINFLVSKDNSVTKFERDIFHSPSEAINFLQDS